LVPAEVFHLPAADASAGEDELETRVVRVALDRGGNGIDVVG